MNTLELINRIQTEQNKLKTELQNSQGMLRLKEVAKNYDGEYKLIWSDDLLEDLKTRPRISPHKTGLQSLDAIIDGFREQQIITIAAHPKHGKTAFGTFLLAQLEELNPVLIPLEQSNEELIQQRFDSGYKVPRFLSPTRLSARVTVDWIEERIVEGIAKYNTRLVVIDHLGYIDDFGEKNKYARENLAYRLGIVMQGLKALAKRWNVVIVVLCHITKEEETKPPQTNDLRGSSSILGESDMVIFLWRKCALKNKVVIRENKTLISVAANRRTGRSGNVGVEFDTATGLFKETEESKTWIDQMEKIAESQVYADDQFGG